MNSSAGSRALGSERAFRVVGYGLVFLMLVCVILSVGRLIHNFVPGWHSSVITGIMLLIVIDRLFLHQRLKSLSEFSAEWVVTFGAQWIVFVVFIRLLLSYAGGMDAFLRDLVHFSQGSIEDFMTPEFLATLFLAMLAWYLAAWFLELLDEIGLNQRLALGEHPGLIQSDASAAHRRLVSLIFILGIVLVLFTALERVDLRATLSNSTGAPVVDPGRSSMGEAGVLLYFILGLALLAQGRLMSLQTSWNVQRIPISGEHFVRQWALYSLIFLFVIVLLVGLLPTGDSLGIFSLLTTLLSFLWMIIYFLWQLIVSVLFLLIGLPFLLFGQEPPLMMEMPEAPVMPPEALAPLPPAGSNAIWILIRSILLWGGLLLIVGLSLRHFLRQHGDLRTALRKAPVLSWLIRAWEWLRQNARRTSVGLSRALAEGWQSLVSRLEGRQILPRPGWIRLRALDPRRQVYFFYLTLVRRGGEQGMPRKPSQTPSEYAVTLAKGLPAAREDIDLITRSFMEARYSRRAVDAGEANLVKATWGRIRRALQERASRERSEEK